MLSAKEAATAVGMSKNGIIRAIHDGRLSATRSSSGQFEIDPAELFRVYAPVSTTDHLSWQVAANETPAQSEGVDEKVTMLERIIRDKDDVIADLRQRLDLATEQNTRLEAMLASQLTPPPKAQVGWWQRLLGQ